MSRTMMAATLALGVFLASGAFAATLTRDGEPAAVIVLGKEPHPVAFEAAMELQRVIARMSGATLPIYLENEWGTGMEGPRRGTTRIFVGDSETAREAGLDLSEVGPEGYVIKTVTFSPTRPSPVTHGRKPKNTHPGIILAGRDEEMQNWGWRGGRSNRYSRGTAYAVYAFLEEDLGVRWLWPGELGEVVAEMKTIEATPADRTGEPKLSKRIFRNGRYNSSGWWRARDQVGTPLPVWTRMEHVSGLWLDHMRMGDGSNLVKPSREGVAGWVEKYGETHPEYFAMQSDGTRLAKTLHGRVRICLSNPDVIALIAKEVTTAFDERPYLTMYGIELSDVYGSYCQCGPCKAWGPTLSDTVARHWAAVAEKVAETHPEKLLYAHPYHKYIDPPTTVKRLPDSIMFFPVGQNTSGYTAAPDRERSRNSWLGWAKLNEQRMMWRPNYPCRDAGLPLNYARKISEDVKLFYANKLSGVDIDHMRSIWAGNGLNYYVACKLFWDPEADYDTLADDYCEKGFGPAGKAMRAYYDAVEEITDGIAEHEETGSHPMGLPGGESGGVGLAVHFAPEVTEKLHAHLDEADTAAGDDGTVKARIAFVRTAVTYAELEHKVNVAGRSLDKGKPTAERMAEVRALLAERQAFIRGFIGRWELEPEAVWTGGDWVERIIADEQAATDMWEDLWLANEEVMTLPEDGWRFATDPEAVSLKEGWFAEDYDDSAWKTIRVGEFWERQGYKDYDGIAWYRRKLTLPASLRGKKVVFAFGAADESADVYIDGELAGVRKAVTGGWDKRFELDLTQHVKPGVEQTYAIRVIDSVGAGGLWKPIKVITPRAAGKAQTISLFPTKDTWLRFNYPTTAYGKDTSLAIGSKDYFRTLLAWELPAGLRRARIRSARIVLPLRYVKGKATYRAYPLTTDWHERRACWNLRDAENPWKDGGGGTSRLPKSPIAEATPEEITAEAAEKAKPAPTAIFDVSLYMNAVAKKKTTFGVLLVGPAPEASMSPHSREAEEEGHRPRLEIAYELQD